MYSSCRSVRSATQNVQRDHTVYWVGALNSKGKITVPAVGLKKPLTCMLEEQLIRPLIIPRPHIPSFTGPWILDPTLQPGTQGVLAE